MIAHAVALSVAVIVAAQDPTPEPPIEPLPPDPATTTDEKPADAKPTIDPALRAEIDRIVDERLNARLAELPQGTAAQEIPTLSFTFKGDFFTKLLLRNNTSGGCVSYGNPAPEGDNFSGDNGICSELGLTIIGRVSDRVEAGIRIQSRFGAQWAEWYENGDLGDEPDGSGESLGQNHAAYLQLRGIYLRAAPPIPTVRSVQIGSSDLGMFNPWTIGKARFTERDNGRAASIEGSFGDPLGY